MINVNEPSSVTISAWNERDSKRRQRGVDGFVTVQRSRPSGKSMMSPYVTRSVHDVR